MFRIAKYLKPYLSAGALVIALLILQAICELNLPNFMAKIVNVGIQQSGIENAAPDAISPEGMRLIATFMFGAEKSFFENSYILVDKADANEKKQVYGSLYPDASGNLYVKAVTDKNAAARLDDTFEIAAAALLGMLGRFTGEFESLMPGDNEPASLDILEIYGIQSLIEALPATEILSAREAASAKELLLTQSGVMLSRAFYNELGADLSARQSSYIIKIGILMLVFAVLGVIASVMANLFSVRIATGTARDLRRDVFRKVESFSNGEFDRFSTASLITRCTNDVSHVQAMLQAGVRILCFAPVMVVGGIIMALRTAVSMNWIIALASAALFLMTVLFTFITMPKFKGIQNLTDKLNLILRENLSGLTVIRAFGTQEHERARFDAANTDMSKADLFVNRILSLLTPFMTIIMNGTVLLIVWVGAHNIAGASLLLGDMLAFIQYAAQIIMSLLTVSAIFAYLPRASVCARRIAEVIDTEVSITDPIGAGAFNYSQKGSVEFKNVSFRYQGAEHDALSNISFTAKPGQTTAVIGSTGAGKTTLLNLIPRLYDANSGQVLVGGIDVRDADLKALRSRIGYAPQKGILVSGSIASNIGLGKKDASDQDIERAASVAQIMGVAAGRYARLSSAVAQGGANISGGQKQRVSIARAIVRNPEIIILDDSLSSLDFKTDVQLRKAIRKHMGDVTVIMVSQRVSAIMNADQIIVLDKGAVAGCGTHKELIASCPEYLEIATSQLSKEELA